MRNPNLGEIRKVIYDYIKNNRAALVHKVLNHARATWGRKHTYYKGIKKIVPYLSKKILDKELDSMVNLGLIKIQRNTVMLGEESTQKYLCPQCCAHKAKIATCGLCQSKGYILQRMLLKLYG